MIELFSGAGARVFGGARFTLINVLPAVLLAIVIAGAYRSNLYDAHRPVDLSAALPTGWLAVQLGFAGLLIGVIAQPFQVAVVRLLEGYGWDRWLPSLLSGMAIERQHRRRARAELLQQAVAVATPGASAAAAARNARAKVRQSRIVAAARARLIQYPTRDDRIMPTTLGNVLRAGEDSAGGRYGLMSMTVYPRMYPFLSDKLDKAISRQLDLIDATSALCLAFAAAALATLPVVVIRHDWWSLLPAGLAASSWLCYRSALNAAKDHGTLFATAFDLHRFDLIKNLHYPLPETVEQEWKFNRALSRFLQRGDPVFYPAHLADQLAASRDLDILREIRYLHSQNPDDRSGGTADQA